MRYKGKTKTAEILKTAFWEIYSENDISKIKISDITEKAGYNRGVFYSYYKNIYEIFDIIEKDVMQHIKDISLLMQSFIINDFDDKYLTNIIKIYNNNEKYLRILFLKDDNPRFKVRMKKMLRDNLINEYKKNNSAPISPKLDYYLEFYSSGMLNMLIYWCINSHKMPVHDFANLIKELVKTEPAGMLKLIYGKC